MKLVIWIACALAVAMAGVAEARTVQVGTEPATDDGVCVTYWSPRYEWQRVTVDPWRSCGISWMETMCHEPCDLVADRDDLIDFHGPVLEIIEDRVEPVLRFYHKVGVGTFCLGAGLTDDGVVADTDLTTPCGVAPTVCTLVETLAGVKCPDVLS